MRSVHFLLSALQLLLSRSFSFGVIALFFARPPLPVYIRAHSRSVSNKFGSLLSAVDIGLNMPPQDTVRPTHGDETAQTMLQLPSLCN